MMIFQLNSSPPATEQLPQRDLKLFIPTETGSTPIIFEYRPTFCFNLFSACSLYHATSALQTLSFDFDPSGKVTVNLPPMSFTGAVESVNDL